MTITVYVTSVTFKKEIHNQQSHIETVLKAFKVDYTMIDLATDPSQKDVMRTKCGDEAALAPQIFNGDTYCGGYKAFQEAVEQECVKSFLGVF